MAEHTAETDQEPGLVARWRQTQPLRLWLYGIAVPLLAALVGYGLLSGHHSVLWLAVLQAALLSGGVEGARQFVVSPATARAAVEEAADRVSGLAAYAVRRGWEDEELEPMPRREARTVLIRYRITS